jgi:PRTRC genetic system ThiF family protein
MNDYFDPHLTTFRSEILVVGLGGTGSILARHVARMIYDMRERRLDTPERIVFIDPDVVEMKNVGRQMFTASDVGQHKAQLLATRFNHALGLKIEWANEPFDPETYGGRYQGRIIMGAVDNSEARRAISKAHGIWIDAGNHFDSGQVVIGTETELSEFEIARGHEWRELPNAALIFPELLEPDPVPQRDLSCAELVEIGEQHLLVNEMMAAISAQYLYKLLHRQPVETFLTYVDTSALVMRSVAISKANVMSYLRQPVAE